jgi:urease accessory protein|tara:strand:+ start:1394 stop:1840 length:447 start_codon:yes stop_codon:yes gene_type:complete
METAFKITHHNDTNKEFLDEISLSYEERFIRRKKLITNNGTEFLVNLKETVSVDENHFFELENGKLIKVISKEENLIEVTGDNLKQIIWHIGNRHLPCQIEENRILIQDDSVILDMILKLQGNVKKVFEKFKPEGGAYGMGRTHSHKH